MANGHGGKRNWDVGIIGGLSRQRGSGILNILGLWVIITKLILGKHSHSNGFTLINAGARFHINRIFAAMNRVVRCANAFRYGHEHRWLKTRALFFALNQPCAECRTAEQLRGFTRSAWTGNLFGLPPEREFSVRCWAKIKMNTG